MPPTQTQSGDAAYSPHNWWGHNLENNDDEGGDHAELDGISKTEWLAHQLLRNAGDTPVRWGWL